MTEDQYAPIDSPKPQEKTSERLFLINQGTLQQIFTQIQELPFRVAEPLLRYVQANVQEVRPDQVKEG